MPVPLHVSSQLIDQSVDDESCFFFSQENIAYFIIITHDLIKLYLFKAMQQSQLVGLLLVDEPYRTNDIKIQYSENKKLLIVIFQFSAFVWNLENLKELHQPILLKSIFSTQLTYFVIEYSRHQYHQTRVHDFVKQLLSCDEGFFVLTSTSLYLMKAMECKLLFSLGNSQISEEQCLLNVSQLSETRVVVTMNFKVEYFIVLVNFKEMIEKSYLMVDENKIALLLHCRLNICRINFGVDLYCFDKLPTAINQVLITESCFLIGFENLSAVVCYQLNDLRSVVLADTFNLQISYTICNLLDTKFEYDSFGRFQVYSVQLMQISSNGSLQVVVKIIDQNYHFVYEFDLDEFLFSKSIQPISRMILGPGILSVFWYQNHIVLQKHETSSQFLKLLVVNQSGNFNQILQTTTQQSVSLFIINDYLVVKYKNQFNIYSFEQMSVSFDQIVYQEKYYFELFLQNLVKQSLSKSQTLIFPLAQLQHFLKSMQEDSVVYKVIGKNIQFFGDHNELLCTIIRAKLYQSGLDRGILGVPLELFFNDNTINSIKSDNLMDLCQKDLFQIIKTEVKQFSNPKQLIKTEEYYEKQSPQQFIQPHFQTKSILYSRVPGYDQQCQFIQSCLSIQENRYFNLTLQQVNILKSDDDLSDVLFNEIKAHNIEDQQNDQQDSIFSEDEIIGQQSATTSVYEESPESSLQNESLPVQIKSNTQTNKNSNKKQNSQIIPRILGSFIKSNCRYSEKVLVLRSGQLVFLHYDSFSFSQKFLTTSQLDSTSTVTLNGSDLFIIQSVYPRRIDHGQSNLTLLDITLVPFTKQFQSSIFHKHGDFFKGVDLKKDNQEIINFTIFPLFQDIKDGTKMLHHNGGLYSMVELGLKQIETSLQKPSIEYLFVNSGLLFDKQQNCNYFEVINQFYKDLPNLSTRSMENEQISTQISEEIFENNEDTSSESSEYVPSQSAETSSVYGKSSSSTSSANVSFIHDKKLKNFRFKFEQFHPFEFLDEVESHNDEPFVGNLILPFIIDYFSELPDMKAIIQQPSKATRQQQPLLQQAVLQYLDWINKISCKLETISEDSLQLITPERLQSTKTYNLEATSIDQLEQQISAAENQKTPVKASVLQIENCDTPNSQKFFFQLGFQLLYLMKQCKQKQLATFLFNPRLVATYYQYVACPLGIIDVLFKIFSTNYRYYAEIINDLQIINANCQVFNEDKPRLIQQSEELTQYLIVELQKFTRQTYQLENDAYFELVHEILDSTDMDGKEGEEVREEEGPAEMEELPQSQKPISDSPDQENYRNEYTYEQEDSETSSTSSLYGDSNTSSYYASY